MAMQMIYVSGDGTYDIAQNPFRAPKRKAVEHASFDAPASPPSANSGLSDRYADQSEAVLLGSLVMQNASAGPAAAAAATVGTTNGLSGNPEGFGVLNASGQNGYGLLAQICRDEEFSQLSSLPKTQMSSVTSFGSYLEQQQQQQQPTVASREEQVTASLIANAMLTQKATSKGGVAAVRHSGGVAAEETDAGFQPADACDDGDEGGLSSQGFSVDEVPVMDAAAISFQFFDDVEKSSFEQGSLKQDSFEQGTFKHEISFKQGSFEQGSFEQGSFEQGSFESDGNMGGGSSAASVQSREGSESRGNAPQGSMYGINSYAPLKGDDGRGPNGARFGSAGSDSPGHSSHDSEQIVQANVADLEALMTQLLHLNAVAQNLPEAIEACVGSALHLKEKLTSSSGLKEAAKDARVHPRPSPYAANIWNQPGIHFVPTDDDLLLYAKRRNELAADAPFQWCPIPDIERDVFYSSFPDELRGWQEEKYLHGSRSVLFFTRLRSNAKDGFVWTVNGPKGKGRWKETKRMKPTFLKGEKVGEVRGCRFLVNPGERGSGWMMTVFSVERLGWVVCRVYKVDNPTDSADVEMWENKVGGNRGDEGGQRRFPPGGERGPQGGGGNGGWGQGGGAGGGGGGSGFRFGFGGQTGGGGGVFRNQQAELSAGKAPLSSITEGGESAGSIGGPSHLMSAKQEQSDSPNSPVDSQSQASSSSPLDPRSPGSSTSPDDPRLNERGHHSGGDGKPSASGKKAAKSEPGWGILDLSGKLFSRIVRVGGKDKKKAEERQEEAAAGRAQTRMSSKLQAKAEPFDAADGESGPVEARRHQAILGDMEQEEQSIGGGESLSFEIAKIITSFMPTSSTPPRPAVEAQPPGSPVEETKPKKKTQPSVRVVAAPTEESWSSRFSSSWNTMMTNSTFSGVSTVPSEDVADVDDLPPQNVEKSVIVGKDPISTPSISRPKEPILEPNEEGFLLTNREALGSA